MRFSGSRLLLGTLGLAALTALPAFGASHDGTATQGGKMMDQGMMEPGLEMPKMDPARGRQLFASKGCVACHSVNGVGGEDAPPLDASTMGARMNPFEFAAKMWRGADAMIYLQREELGEQVELSGQELADIIAFTHNKAEQAKFSDGDVPPRIRELMMHLEGDEHHEEEDMHEKDQ